MRKLLAVLAAILVAMPVGAQTRRVAIPAGAGTMPDSAIRNAMRPITDSLRAADAALARTDTALAARDLVILGRLDSLIAALKPVTPLPPPPTPDTLPTPIPQPPPPIGGNLLALFDWSGTTSLPYHNGNGRLTVGTGRGFLNARHLLVEAADGQHSWVEVGFHQEHGFIPAPVLGDVICLRYRKAVLLNVSGLSTHGDYFESREVDGWGPTTAGWDEETFATSYSIALMPGADARMSDGNGYRPFWVTGLQYNVPYTREIEYRYLSSTSYSLKARVWDGTGRLIHDSDTGAFVSTGWYDNGALRTKMPITQSGGGANGVRGFIVGTNGFDRGVGSTLRPLAAYAGLVVQRGGCPGYPMVAGER